MNLLQSEFSDIAKIYFKFKKINISTRDINKKLIEIINKETKNKEEYKRNIKTLNNLFPTIKKDNITISNKDLKKLEEINLDKYANNKWEINIKDNINIEISIIKNIIRKAIHKQKMKNKKIEFLDKVNWLYLRDKE